MEIALGIYSLIIGLAFGSFALAMADRMKSKKNWVNSRSKCDHCGHKLSIPDLTPVLSWLWQGGKCRYCKKKLSAYYPLVEIGSGLAFLISYIYLPYEVEGQFAVLFGLWIFSLVLMTALVVFDLKWYKLPNKLVYPLILTSLFHRILQYYADNQVLSEVVLPTVLSVLVGAGIFWGLYQLSKGQWIGDGDYRLGVAIGLFLADPLVTWLALFIASVAGLIIMLPFIVKNRSTKKLKLKIPFGPFLILGLYVSYLFGSSIVDWYLDTFLYL